MSRRPANANAERAAANQQTLKTLVKLESNKSCADCKRNKHPRWASWNLGIFVCIRCSGIHRGMGTHISRVKSVDLDAWTDEQLANMLRWGNARANVYWEHKLAPGHVPSDSKMENFIRTKYDSKRWVMEGPMPDPSTLDTASNEDVPVQVAKEAVPAAVARSAPEPTKATATRQNADVDLFGDSSATMAPVPTTRSGPPPPLATAASKPQAAPRAPVKTGDSLLGFDFFGNHTQAGVPGRPSSAAAALPSSTGPSRPDLKQSILSLYATSSRPSTPAQTVVTPSAPASKTSGLSNLTSDFGGLDFGAPAAPAPERAPVPPVTSPASFVTSPVTQPTSTVTSIPLSSGSFFDTKPVIGTAAAPLSRPIQHPRQFSTSSGFGDFESATDPGWGDPSPPTAKPAPAAPSNMLDDILDFSAPAPAAATTSKPMDNAFNLSAPKPAPPKLSQPTTTVNTTPAVLEDPWGSNDAWSTPAPAPAPIPAPAAAPTATPAPKEPAPMPSGGDDWGWGGNGTTATTPAPPVTMQSSTITQDEDFGGWESFPSATTPAATQPPKASVPAAKPGGGFGSNDNDLFSNVWG